MIKSSEKDRIFNYQTSLLVSVDLLNPLIVFKAISVIRLAQYVAKLVDFEKCPWEFDTCITNWFAIRLFWLN